MKKKNLMIIVTIIVALIITYCIVNILNIYHFNCVPTMTTLIYIIFILSIMSYLLFFFLYFIWKKRHLEKIKMEQYACIIMCFVALILMLFFLLMVDIDWLSHEAVLSPFYMSIIVRGFQFLLPSAILIVLSLLLIQGNSSK